MWSLTLNNSKALVHNVKNTLKNSILKWVLEVLMDLQQTVHNIHSKNPIGDEISRKLEKYQSITKYKPIFGEI